MNMTDEERARKEQEICNLLSDLSSPVSEIGDWKVIKCQECIMAGEEAPYDIAALHAARNEARERIEELRRELDPKKPEETDEF